MPHSPVRDPRRAFDPATPAEARRGLGLRLLDGLAFSNLLPAAIAVGLSLAASVVIDPRVGRRAALIAGCGTFVVYGLDRLRDTERDRATSPLRTAFTLRHARSLGLLVALAAAGLIGALAFAPLRIGALCLAVGAFGIFHRRLKRYAALKTLYVSLAWVAGCVGIPWLWQADASATRAAAWTALIFFTAIAANLVASNHRDGEAHTLAERAHWTLGLARAVAVLGFGVAFVAPTELRGLAWIPLAEILALALYRPGEHYGLVAVDGALLLGALASLAHAAAF